MFSRLIYMRKSLKIHMLILIDINGITQSFLLILNSEQNRSVVNVRVSGQTVEGFGRDHG